MCRTPARTSTISCTMSATAPIRRWRRASRTSFRGTGTTTRYRARARAEHRLTLLAKALYYWRGFAMGSVNRRIFSAMVVIMAATFLVKVAAVAKDIVLAGKFGLTDEVDAFLMALAIPALA